MFDNRRTRRVWECVLSLTVQRYQPGLENGFKKTQGFSKTKKSEKLNFRFLKKN